MSLLKEAIKATTLYDWLLLIILLSAVITAFFSVRTLFPAGETVTVEVNGKVTHRLSLLEDKIIEVSGPLGVTRIEVKKGRVRILESPCPDKICMLQGWTERGSIICLPNRVVITVGDDLKDGIDAITG